MVLKEDIIKELIRANPWWETGEVREPDLEVYKRDVFPELVEYMDEPEICGIIGARRTGKTTLMYQLVAHLLDSGVKPERVVMFTFDNPLMTEDKEIIMKIIETHEEMYETKKTRYVFLDEIQYVDDWSRWIKARYDRNEGIKFILSGSSGKLIYKNTSESLTGRISFFETDPFSFREYCEFNGTEGLKDLLKSVSISKDDLGYINSTELRSKIEFYGKELRRLFNDYVLYGGIPESFKKNLHKAQKWLKEDYIGLVFYRDLMELFDIRDTRMLEELFYYIAKTNGQRSNYTKIGDMLDSRVETVKTYLGYLEIAGLIRIIEHYSKSPKRSKRAEKKLFISDSGILNAVEGNDKTILTDSKSMGSIIEGVVCTNITSDRLDIFPKNVFYWRSVHELDFVIKENEGLLPIEVKYTSTIDTGDLKGLLSFMKKYDINEGIVLTREKHDVEDIDGNKIYYIPVWIFLLS